MKTTQNPKAEGGKGKSRALPMLPLFFTYKKAQKVVSELKKGDVANCVLQFYNIPVFRDSFDIISYLSHSENAACIT